MKTKIQKREMYTIFANGEWSQTVSKDELWNCLKNLRAEFPWVEWSFVPYEAPKFQMN